MIRTGDPMELASTITTAFLCMAVLFLMLQWPSLRAWSMMAPVLVREIIAGQSSTVEALRNIIEGQQRMSDDIQTIISKLHADMTVQTTVVGGFTTFVTTLKAQYTEAMTAARAGGASEAALSELNKLDGLITQNTSTLQALTSNTAVSAELIPTSNSPTSSLTPVPDLPAPALNPDPKPDPAGSPAAAAA